MNKIDWQTGAPLKEGNYLVTFRYKDSEIKYRMKKGKQMVQFVDVFKTAISIAYWDKCIWDNYDDDESHCKIVAWCSLKDIQPYVEPKFKIGEIVVENGIIGTITAMNDDGTYYVVGAALMPMTFTPSMCRLATPNEALSLGAKWRERGMYYDIKTNELKKL